MKRTALKRRTPLRAKKKTTKKRKTKRYQAPKWFTKLPTGSHGSTPAQKRLWKVVSDLVRERDWHKYQGRCVSCGTYIPDWKAGDAGHWIPWSTCNSWFKFDQMNVALQCKGCNIGLARKSRADIGHAFGEELNRRYGIGTTDYLREVNKTYVSKKLEDHQCVDYVARLRPDLVDCE